MKGSSVLALALSYVGSAMAQDGSAAMASTSTVRILNGTAGYIPLPSLANQFEAVIEANIYNRGYTIHMHEWHDEVADAGRTDTFSARGGTESSSVYDYATNRYFHTSPDGCEWGDMAHISGRRNFGGGNGAHVTSSAELMSLDDRQGMDYTGTGLARGILCDTWTDTRTRGMATYGNYSSMVLKFFFSHSSWSIPEDNFERVPVRVELSGMRANSNRSAPRGTDRTLYNEDGTVSFHEYYHVYDYTSFQAGPVDAAAFARPCGTRCFSTNTTWDPTILDVIGCPGDCDTDNTPVASIAPAATGGGGGFGGGGGQPGGAPAPPPAPPTIDNPPTMPVLPNAFEAKIEANIRGDKPSANHTIHMHEWFDYDANKGRTDWYRSGGPGRTAGYTTSIYNYADNRYYHTNTTGGCTWGDMDHIGDGFSMMAGSAGEPHVTTSAELLDFGGGAEEIYMGQVTVRGILCDYWTSSQNFTMSQNTSQPGVYSFFDVGMYFAAETWSIPESEGTRVPVRMTVVGQAPDYNYTTFEVIGSHTFDHVYDYTSFHVGVPDASSFDQPCGTTCTSTNTTWNSDVVTAPDCASACPVATGAVVVPPTTHAGLPAAPVAPAGALTAQVFLEADAAVITYNSPARVAFEADFKGGMATELDVTADQVVIVGISAGSVIVDFFITDPGAVDLAAVAAVSTIGSLTVTANVDCVETGNTASACLATCEVAAATVTTPPLAGGIACTGDYTCSPGDGLCPAPATPAAAPAPAPSGAAGASVQVAAVAVAVAALLC